MQDFLYKLYDMEDFTTVIIIAIVVLSVLFLLILMLGKKDQKLEETKKLEKLAMQGFKDESSTKLGEVKPRENIDILLPPQPKLEKKEDDLTLSPTIEVKEEKTSDLVITEFEKNDPISILETSEDKINIDEEKSFSSLDKTMVDIDHTNLNLGKIELDEPVLIDPYKEKLKEDLVETKKIPEPIVQAPLLNPSNQMLEDTIIFPAITEDLIKQNINIPVNNVQPVLEKEIDLFKLTTQAETVPEVIEKPIVPSFEETMKEDVFATFDAEEVEKVEIKKVEVPSKPAQKSFNYDDLLNDLDLSVIEDKGNKKAVFSSVYSPTTDMPEELNVVNNLVSQNIDKTMQMPRLKSEMIANNEEFTFNSILGETYDV